MKEGWGCITIVLLFVITIVIGAIEYPLTLLGEFYTNVVGSDGWNIFIIILSLVCGYLVYRAASEDNNE